MDLASWGLGLLLIVLTIAIHTTAVVLMAFVLEAHIRPRLPAPAPALRRAIPTMVGRIAIVTLILAALHGLEAVLWALAYWHLGALDDFTHASIYSLATMTTFEIPDVTTAPRFHMISAVQTVNGVLLFGITTAFLFAVLQVHWQLISRRGQEHV
ncbi:hypothetical protein [Mycobacterium sp. 1274761.0]|uniref:hypothetical protein n=1 Tax=Mycobacterium sp. 1274761.0 TaxID=1834077 RepID=UPI0007FFA2B7|nr:hypothetical protein [Mycobacterium sp. 1274761.0]OBK73527.1 hypothetical protein A5651_13915 [Mycobacterium sp. 1274761.0]